MCSDARIVSAVPITVKMKHQLLLMMMLVAACTLPSKEVGHVDEETTDSYLDEESPASETDTKSPATRDGSSEDTGEALDEADDGKDSIATDSNGGSNDGDSTDGGGISSDETTGGEQIPPECTSFFFTNSFSDSYVIREGGELEIHDDCVYVSSATFPERIEYRFECPSQTDIVEFAIGDDPFLEFLPPEGSVIRIDYRQSASPSIAFESYEHLVLRSAGTLVYASVRGAFFPPGEFAAIDFSPFSVTTANGICNWVQINNDFTCDAYRVETLEFTTGQEDATIFTEGTDRTLTADGHDYAVAVEFVRNGESCSDELLDRDGYGMSIVLQSPLD